MPRIFDEISLQFWDTNKKQVGSSKSYTCYHEGYVYGDEMSFENIEYVYRKDGKEEHYAGIKNGPKWAYFAFVQAACRKSEVTLQSFLTNPAEKFRIYTEAQVQSFSTQKKNSTRIKDQSCLIIVDEVKYYVANNLKVCEYFNSAAMNTDSSEKGNWFIRIFFDDTVLQRLEDREESEEINTDLQTYKITAISSPITSGKMHSHTSHSIETIVKIDYGVLNQMKKKIGDLGEAIVLDYEYKRLVSHGRQDLADGIEHTSKVKGDNAGYDILSYSEDGNPLYIEVKTTKQNRISDFYLSENERVVGNQKLSEGKNYRIYRIYNLNPVTGTGNLAIYEPPFDTEHYSMKAENWRIQLKE